VKRVWIELRKLLATELFGLAMKVDLQESVVMAQQLVALAARERVRRGLAP
jgi:hypothetical protein